MSPVKNDTYGFGTRLAMAERYSGIRQKNVPHGSMVGIVYRVLSIVQFVEPWSRAFKHILLRRQPLNDAAAVCAPLKSDAGDGFGAHHTAIELLTPKKSAVKSPLIRDTD